MGTVMKTRSICYSVRLLRMESELPVSILPLLNGHLDNLALVELMQVLKCISLLHPLT